MEPVRQGVARGLTRRDALFAAASTLIPFALYVRTVLPDFGGPEDTPKFQFLGYVLGTAHPPGYPLYVLLSHLFVQLPIGTVAYRANLFSALLAAVACALAYLIGRRISSSRWASLCAVLAMATGASFWRSAVFAEVYSLAAVMSALTVLLLLTWAGRAGAGLLIAAAAAFAAGMGNHLTLAGVAPACAIYVLARNRRVLTGRVLAAIVVVLALGAGQYAFILIRTRQDAPYLESRATTVRELIGVMKADRFAGQRFAFSPMALATVQIPFTASVAGRDLGVAGVVLLALGLATGIRRRSADVTLVAGAAAGLFFMIVNLSGDVSGFVTSLMVLLWPLAAVGIDALARLVSQRLATLRTAVLAAAALLPAAQVRANYRATDQREQTREATFIRNVYAQLPDRAAVVNESYFYDMALEYMGLTGEGGPDRGIRRIPFGADAVRAAAREGRRVFAFAGGATFLAGNGLVFERAAVRGLPLGEWLNALPHGTVVLGASAYAPLPVEIERRDTAAPRPSRHFAAFVMVGRQPGLIRRLADDEGVSVAIEPGTIATPLPGDVRAEADARRGGRITIGGRPIVDVDAGLALAVFTPQGTLERTIRFAPDEAVRVPFAEALYELRGESPCTQVTTAAEVDVTSALATGSWVATLVEMGAVSIDLTFDAPIAWQSSEQLGGGTIVAVPDGVVEARTARVTLTRNDERRTLYRQTFDRLPASVHARVRPGGVRDSVTLCAQAPVPLVKPGVTRAEMRADFESEAYFGAGWGAAERTPTGYVRRAGRQATLLLPVEAGHGYRLDIDLDVSPGTGVTVTSNGVPLDGCIVSDERRCRVDIPAGTAREGVNAVTLSLHETGGRLVFRGGQIARSDR